MKILLKKKQQNIIISTLFNLHNYSCYCQVIADVDSTCSALSHKLGQSQWFCGDSPTELDALAFGYVHLHLHTFHIF